jgi:hypothetical protein
MPQAWSGRGIEKQGHSPGEATADAHEDSQLGQDRWSTRHTAAHLREISHRPAE